MRGGGTECEPKIYIFLLESFEGGFAVVVLAKMDGISVALKVPCRVLHTCMLTHQ